MVELSLAIIVASLPELKVLLPRNFTAIKMGSTATLDLRENIKLVELSTERKDATRQV